MLHYAFREQTWLFCMSILLRSRTNRSSKSSLLIFKCSYLSPFRWYQKYSTLILGLVENRLDRPQLIATAFVHSHQSHPAEHTWETWASITFVLDNGFFAHVCNLTSSDHGKCVLTNSFLDIAHILWLRMPPTCRTRHVGNSPIKLQTTASVSHQSAYVAQIWRQSPESYDQIRHGSRRESEKDQLQVKCEMICAQILYPWRRYLG